MPMGMAGGAVCSFYTGLLVRRAIRGTVIVIVVTIVPRPAARRRDARHGRETCTRPRIASPSAIGRIARIDPANKNSLKLASDPDARRGCRADWSLAGHVAGAPAYAVRRTPTPQVTRRIAVVPPARQRPTPDARTLDGPRSIALLRSLCLTTRDACPVSRTCLASRRRAPRVAAPDFTTGSRKKHVACEHTNRMVRVRPPTPESVDPPRHKYPTKQRLVPSSWIGSHQTLLASPTAWSS